MGVVTLEISESKDEGGEGKPGVSQLNPIGRSGWC